MLLQVDEEPEVEYKKKFGQGKEFGEALEIAQKWQKKYATAAEIPINEIPAEYDFRNINGYDFTSQVRN